METLLWLRSETKAFERRTPLVAEDAKELVENRIKVIVESSDMRVIPDSDYLKAGCKLVPAGTWREAPKWALILGLKELWEDVFPLRHRHIYFAHAYKNQAGAQTLLSRFVRGRGELLDLEFLLNEQGRRVAAFGHWAGYAGAALAVLNWCWQKEKPTGKLSAIQSYKNQFALTEQLRAKLSTFATKPTAIVVGSQGRCGRGALKLLHSLGISTAEWDMEETKQGGPFKQILQYDLFINCILLENDIRPFLTLQLLEEANRNLTVMSDVSCDPKSPNNPIPIYTETTTFQNPVLRLKDGTKPLDLIAIDHLPALLPLESSQDFSDQLLPHLRNLCLSEDLPPVWRGAREIYRKKTSSIRTTERSRYDEINRQSEVQL